MALRNYLATLVIFAGIALADAASADITFAGGDGSSAANAIIIVGAAGEGDGVQSEYDWLSSNRAGATVKSQALMQDGDRIFDALTIEIGGKQKDVFFDITAFFGK